jgi:hypothetical protein
LRCSTGKICRRLSVKCSRCSPRLELSSLLLLYFVDFFLFCIFCWTFSDYFKPRKHTSFERHVFRHAKQKKDETIDNFIVRFSKLSVSCEYTVDYGVSSYLAFLPIMSTSVTTIALRCSTGKICRRLSVKCSRCSPRLELSIISLSDFRNFLFRVSIQLIKKKTWSVIKL